MRVLMIQLSSPGKGTRPGTGSGRSYVFGTSAPWRCNRIRSKDRSARTPGSSTMPLPSRARTKPRRDSTCSNPRLRQSRPGLFSTATRTRRCSATDNACSCWTSIKTPRPPAFASWAQRALNSAVRRFQNRSSSTAQSAVCAKTVSRLGFHSRRSCGNSSWRSRLRANIKSAFEASSRHSSPLHSR